MTVDDIPSGFERAYKEQATSLGRVNLALMGKSGAGKSTLVNAIFPSAGAVTGIGAPVTRGVDRFVNDSGTLGIFDCEGFELGRSTKEAVKWIKAQLKSNRQGQVLERIHVVWYCVQWSDRRMTDGQVELIKELSGLDLPVILVMTQVPLRDGELHGDAVEFAKYLDGLDLPVVGGKVFMSDAVGDSFSGTQPHGVGAVLDATFAAVPEEQRPALNAAQGIDWHRKSVGARQAITVAAGAAAAVGAVPIPFADAVVLVPIQLAMMAKIALVYGVSATVATQASVAATSAATSAGKYVVTALAKLVPGVGSTISAATAAMLTASMGEAWRVVCEKLANGQIPESAVNDAKTLGPLFMAAFKEQLKRPALHPLSH